MKKIILISGVIVCAAIFFTGCNFESAESTPTAEAINDEPINPLPNVAESTLTATATMSPSPSFTPAEVVQITSATPMPTEAPSASPFPTETPGPWEYTVQDGDTLGFIIQQPPFNYRTFDVISEIVRINPNIPNENSLPGAGSVILIPRPTATPIPVGVELTQAFAATLSTIPELGIPIYSITGPHVVRQGDTIVSIIEQYAGLTLEIFARLNRDINFIGCNFEQPGGGPNCNPLIREGQEVIVILPTPTLTLTPTPSDNEPPTATPTSRAPTLVSPTEGGIAAGTVILQWVSVGVLNADEVYLIQITDVTAETSVGYVTQNTSYRLPASIIPPTGETHEIEWTVSVARADSNGAYAPVGAAGRAHTFKWQGR
jgi:hypothetical protein